MVIAESHKGSFCVYTPKFCQEGYCPGCEIYLKKSLPIQKEDRRLVETLQEVGSTHSLGQADPNITYVIFNRVFL